MSTTSLGENIVSITQSSRPVKVAGKLFGAKQSGWLRIYRIHLGTFEGVQKTEETLHTTPRLMRIERQAKAPAPWAGVRYSPVVARCPCSPDQPVRPGFRYCWDCLSIASTDANFREDDYRDRRAA